MDIVDAFPLVVVAHDIVHSGFVHAEDNLVGIPELADIGNELVGIHSEHRTAAGSGADSKAVDVNAVFGTIDPELDFACLGRVKREDRVAVIDSLATLCRFVDGKVERLVVADLDVNRAASLAAVLAEVNGHSSHLLKLEDGCTACACCAGLDTHALRVQKSLCVHATGGVLRTRPVACPAVGCTITDRSTNLAAPGGRGERICCNTCQQIRRQHKQRKEKYSKTLHDILDFWIVCTKETYKSTKNF